MASWFALTISCEVSDEKNATINGKLPCCRIRGPLLTIQSQMYVRMSITERDVDPPNTYIFHILRPSLGPFPYRIPF